MIHNVPAFIGKDGVGNTQIRPTHDFIPSMPDVSAVRSQQASRNLSKTNFQVVPKNLRTGMGYKSGQKIQSYKKGGLVHQTGLAMLHKGELVVPKHAVDTMHKKWMLSDSGAVKYSDHSDSQ